MSEPIYDTYHYSVLVLEEPVVDEKGEFPPLNYVLYNKLTKREEVSNTYLPAAIETAIALNEKLESFFPKDTPAIMTLH